MQKKALIIGVVTYLTVELNAIGDAVKTDIARMHAVCLMNGYSSTTIDSPTANQLREVVRAAAAEIDNDDFLLVYFSGHGVEYKNRIGLVPSDVDPSSPLFPQAVVTASELGTYAASARGKVVLCSDCCRETRRPPKIDCDYYPHQTAGYPNNFGLFHACANNEYAQTVNSGGQAFSIFTRSVGAAMSPVSSAKTLGEVVSEAKAFIGPLSTRFSRPAQSPEFTASDAASLQILSDMVVSDSDSRYSRFKLIDNGIEYEQAVTASSGETVWITFPKTSTPEFIERTLQMFR